MCRVQNTLSPRWPRRGLPDIHCDVRVHGVFGKVDDLIAQRVDTVLLHRHLRVLDLCEPLGVGFVVLISLVFDHPVTADANIGSGNLHPIQCDPVVDIIVFSSPTPVLVGETIDLQELRLSQTGNSSEISGIRKPAREKQ